MMDFYDFDPSMNLNFDNNLGFNSMPLSCDAFMNPTATQIQEAGANLDPTLDVSNFGLNDWMKYDPYNLDIRNPYVGGYPTLGSDWDPLTDYDPYAPNIYQNMQGAMQAISMNQAMTEFHDSMPVSSHHDSYHSEPSETQQKLDESNSIERERDTAVDNYNDAKRSGNIDEMLKWETIANDRQQDLYNLWDTAQYGLPAKAPGIA